MPDDGDKAHGLFFNFMYPFDGGREVLCKPNRIGLTA